MYSLMVEFHYKFSNTQYTLIGYGTYDEIIDFGKNHLADWIDKNYHEEVGRFRNNIDPYIDYICYPYRIHSI